MKTDIRALRLELNGLLRTHVTRRLEFALGQFRRHVEAVQARLEDVNGPAGGTDKLCAVTVRARGLTPLRAEVLDSDVFAAVDRAAGIASRRLARALERRRDTRVGRSRRSKREGR